MTIVTAEQVRRDALTRLCDLAGDHVYDLDILTARPESRQILQRRVLRAHGTDLTVRAELDRIWPLCEGRAAALDDCVHAGGLDPEAPPTPTVSDLEQALAGWSTP